MEKSYVEVTAWPPGPCSTTDPATGQYGVVTDDYYAIDTASVSRGDAIRDLTLTDRWNTRHGKPNGGYILAAMLRGLAEESANGGASAEPMVASITYFKVGIPGPAELHTAVLRPGRRVTTAEATLWQGESKIAHMVGSFGDRDGGHTHELGQPPSLPPVDECTDPWGGNVPGMPIAERIDYRVKDTPGWVVGKPTGDPSADVWMRLAGERDADVFASALLVDGYAPPIFELGNFPSVTIQLTVHFHGAPAPGWIASHFTTRHIINGHHEEDCELWDSTGRLVAQSRQLALIVDV